MGTGGVHGGPAAGTQAAQQLACHVVCFQHHVHSVPAWQEAWGSTSSKALKVSMVGRQLGPREPSSCSDMSLACSQRQGSHAGCERHQDASHL